ncbi:MAG: response regulator [Chloroflexi bacterium]|nr:response regulator [Chloroflexota bacterium]
MSDKTRVLVVDDEIDTLNLLKLLLEVSGFDPIATLNSVEALQLAELEAPDVILLDIMMPKLDGFALCKMMRQHPAIKNRPIIFVTAYEALDLEERKEDAGADAVVPKPIDMNKLTETIEVVRTNRAKPQPAAVGENHKPPVPEPQMTKEAENVKPEVKTDGKTTQTAKKVESKASDKPVVMRPPEPRKPQPVEKKDDKNDEGK